VAELRVDPDLLPGALEEVLRYRPAVCVQTSSANRDETAFDDPDRFDIRRKPHRNFGFGQGIDFCMDRELVFS